MIGVVVTFDYKGEIDPSLVTKIAEEARGLFEGMPGLRYKIFTLDEKNAIARNLYVWDSDLAAREFFNDQIRGRIAGLYGVEPTIDYVDVVGIVDNT
jgi:hypothetical protein